MTVMMHSSFLPPLRRSLLLLAAASLIAAAGCSTAATPEKQPATSAPTAAPSAVPEVVAELNMQAPTGISITAPYYKLIADNALQGKVQNVKLTPWNNPDELRARISSGQVQISAVPSYVGANFYNKGAKVQLLNVIVWGNLYLLGPAGETTTWESLKGKSVYVPFKGDMPDLLFQYMLKKNNLTPQKDVQIQYAAAPAEIVGLLAAGKADYAVLPEHVASLAISKMSKTEKPVKKAFLFQEEWKKATGKPARFPQAGTVISADFAKKHPEIVATIQSNLKKSVDWINANPKEASVFLEKNADGLQPAFIEGLIPSLHLSFMTAQEAKEELNYFYGELMSLSPEIIGGKLPDDGFYYAP